MSCPGLRVLVVEDSGYVAAYLLEMWDGDIQLMPFFFGSEFSAARAASKAPQVIAVDLGGPEILSASIIWGPMSTLEDIFYDDDTVDYEHRDEDEDI